MIDKRDNLYYVFLNPAPRENSLSSGNMCVTASMQQSPPMSGLLLSLAMSATSIATGIGGTPKALGLHLSKQLQPTQSGASL